ncbi:DUF2279 domain-containing protein [Longibacter salinarum]|nr:DUF2279 domain-containing protein [Longibacter salinarum]
MPTATDSVASDSMASTSSYRSPATAPPLAAPSRSIGAWSPLPAPQITPRLELPESVRAVPPRRSSMGRSGIRWGRFAGVTAALAAGYTGIYLFERKQWWDGPGSGFKFDSHLNYARNFDKISHLYAGEVQALINARLLEWSGVPKNQASLWGAVTSLAAQTHVEIHDGYSARWGFDWYDQAANTVGAAWFYAHDRIPAMRRFDLRWSYYPSNAWLKNLEERQKEGTMFADDYSGHAYWMSMQVYDLLPGALGRAWPEFLQVSVGASLHDWTDDTWSLKGPERGRDPDAYVAYYVSLDVDWRKVIPRNSWLGRSAGDFLNRFHLPFPAVRVWPEPGVHLIFVGQK